MYLAPSVTQVKAYAIIERERTLPLMGEVLVRRGQEVSPVQVVARAPRQNRFTIIPAAEMLAVAPEELPAYLLVEEGATVQRGMALWRGRRRSFGRSQRHASPVDGVVAQVRDGCLVIKQAAEQVELRALMQGRVAAIIPGRGVILEAQGALIQALWDSGKEAYGRLRVAVTAADEALDPGRLGAEAHGAIVVGGRLARQADLQRLEESGARGVIAGSMPAALAAVARQQLTLPVFLTDGFGAQPMAEPIFRLLQSADGRETTLFARLPARPGSRPEIVIPLPVGQFSGVEQAPAGILHIGAPVRVWRLEPGPATGEIVALPTQPSKMATGAPQPVVGVRLSSGEVVAAPLSNLDLIV